jgi:hypothetical protein
MQILLISRRFTNSHHCSMDSRLWVVRGLQVEERTAMTPRTPRGLLEFARINRLRYSWRIWRLAARLLNRDDAGGAVFFF